MELKNRETKKDGSYENEIDNNMLNILLKT